MNHIYYLCPDSDLPIGGVKKIYQHVDILNELGLKAFVLHEYKGFRCTWFHHNTPIAYSSRITEELTTENDSLPPLCKEDILVIPEVMVKKTIDFVTSLGLDFVIFNQSAYYTFMGQSTSFNEGDLKSIYKNKNLLGVITISENSKKYLEYSFGTLDLFRVHLSIDFSLFSYQNKKKKQIAYMPRRCGEEASQIISILCERGFLTDWTLAPIHNIHETEVATILKESAIFLSFSRREGFGLPPLEAISCGCIVIGYHGGGGEEYFHGPTIFPIVPCEIIEFAQTIEKIALNYDSSQEEHLKLTLDAKNVIQNKYSIEREKKDLTEIWKALLEKHELLQRLSCTLHPLDS